MKILLMTHGSRGDVQPFAALARALVIAGHDVLLCAPASSAGLVEPYPVKFFPLNDAIGEWMTKPGVLEAVERGYRGVSGKRILAKSVRQLHSLMEVLLADMAAVVREVAPKEVHDIDLVVHHVEVPGHEIAERLGVPSVPVCLQPSWVPTAAFPNPAVRRSTPHPLNRKSYLWTMWRYRFLVGGTAKWRTRTLGLPRRHGHHDFFRQPDGSPSVTLQAFSSLILPSPLDYPDSVHTTGFWYLPAAPNWQPTRALLDFLEAGEPPVYFGFGSMVSTNPRWYGRVVADAVRRTGVRAVVAGGWGGIRMDEGKGGIFYVEQAPHDWLFPRMAAVVHHGGCGTTGAALVSGKPQLICPFLYDQRFYGKRVWLHGVAARPLPPQALNEASLAAAVHRCVTDESLAVNAERLGKDVRTEAGVEQAISILESLSRS
jgi:sterol 3beta-glucosyltransferase